MHQSTESTSNSKWYVECGATLENGKFIRNEMMLPKDTFDFRFKHDNKGVYMTAYMYDSTDQKDANMVGNFYLDFDYDLTGEDKEESFDIIRKDVAKAMRYLKVFLGIEKEQVLLFFSGSKGVHLIVPWEVMGVSPSKNLNRYYRMLAEDISAHTSGKTLDLKIYDNRRLLRMANSIHQKTGLYKISISYEELTDLKLKEIQELAKDSRQIPQVSKKLSQKAQVEMLSYEKKFKALINRASTAISKEVNLDYMPPCVEALLDGKVAEGQRNTTAAFLSNYFKQSGLSREEAAAKLTEWGQNNCDPPMSERVINTTVSSIYNGSAKMGCSTGKTISTCDEKSCKLSKKGRN